MRPPGTRRARIAVATLALLSLAAAGGYLASLPSEKRSCALRWSDGLTTERCVQRMHE